MPSLGNHQSATNTKLLLIGDSGSGKTGALLSLVKAGYKLRILDFDNGLDSLATLVKRDAPEYLSNIEFVTLRDKLKGSNSGPILDGMPTAFTQALKLLDHWKDGDNDLGKPALWGAECVLVVDSLTFMSDAAFNWAESMNPAAKDRRQIYGAAQDAVEHVLALLTSPSFATNVIVIAHVKYMDRPDGSTKGFPTSIGNALSPKIPAYFNNVALCETKGFGGKLTRILRTQSSLQIDLKSPASFNLAPELPIDNALATFFESNRK